MKNLCTTLLAVAAVLLVTACSRLTEDNLQKIHNGMSTDEVKAILGDPTDSQTKTLVGISTTTFTYHTNTSNVAITFLNDKVVATEGDFK
ncbi:MAG: outer membrane protein assembly factor BamE [Methylacidiphilales bacterium]|nr:outer membrane protein assembly factor BamE [Candidatus Methylacidiphilales bacterium]